jgi:hypothetical protein
MWVVKETLSAFCHPVPPCLHTGEEDVPSYRETLPWSSNWREHLGPLLRGLDQPHPLPSPRCAKELYWQRANLTSLTVCGVPLVSRPVKRRNFLGGLC